MAELANSTFLDFSSYGTLPDSITDPATAFQLTGTGVVTDPTTTVTIALIIERASDPTALLNSDWATRQTAVAEMAANDTLASLYGAESSAYTAAQTLLQGMSISSVGDSNGADGYVTSQASRTIWVELDATQFQALFGTALMTGTSSANGEMLYWNGNLSLPDSIASSVVGLWPDLSINPATRSLTDTTITLAQDAQSAGNASADETNLFPQDIAALYNFPLAGTAVETGTLALIEPSIGDAVTDEGLYGSFADRLNTYLQTAGIDATADYYVANRDNQSYFGDGAGERSLDVGVVSTVVPNSRLGLYVGSAGTVFTSYQTAIWDITNNPAVISSSWSDGVSFAPDSPFATAYRELFVDAALRGIAVFNDAFDGGSGNETETGLTNLFVGSMSPFAMVVGGTSLSTLGSAQADSTLADAVSGAAAGDLGTIWQLVRGGLKDWSASLTDQSVLIETVWNQYFLTDLTMWPNYLVNSATSGGVDTTQTTPSYQSDYGLTPTDADPAGGTGRGAPDVSAIAGGNMNYLVPDANMRGLSESGGTSAATPLWASLATQINAIFADQGLPTLGYSNDLYYIASAIAPASFNDVTLGNNISSYVTGDDYFMESDGVFYGISASGYGYQAGEGYDLTTGLGTPNGILLARALSTIAHSQLYFDLTPVLEGTGGVWASVASESLLFQTAFSDASTWSLTLGSASYSFAGTASASYAWTAALAQQSLQSDFSADLVTMFDGYAQGQIYQTTVAAGTNVSIEMAGLSSDAYQAALTSDYGFMDFATADGAVEVARAVAVATTAGGADDQDVVVRMRQNGMNDISVSFYEVDTYAGAIDGLMPGDAGYEAAAAARTYLSTAGLTSISGGGYGAYSQTEIIGVDAGDLIAMKITSAGNTFWAFAQANELVDGANVAHMWSYGLNTWGWEDLYGGGDQDYNDLVVQLDFTSVSGSGFLV